MPEKDGSNVENAAKIDFHALESEIDKEIDLLFVPAVRKSAGGADDAVPLGAPEFTLEPAAIKPKPNPAATLDFDALQAEIDREIDTLFVPLADKKNGSEETGLKLDPQPKAKPKAGENRTGSQTGSSVGVARSNESQAFVPPYPAGFNRLPGRDELPRLVELFNAAYLSLDWEFSRENIRKLQTALKELSPFATVCTDAAPIFKILNTVLDRLHARPQAANNKIIELIRDSQGLLAHILFLQGEAGQDEKERVNELISRFLEMRQKAIASKAAALKPKAPTFEMRDPKVEVELPNVEMEAVQEIAPSSAQLPDTIPARELRLWLEATHRSVSDALCEIDSQIRRIREIEVMFAKTPALAPVADNLMKVRIGLDRQAAILKEKGADWQDRIAWLDNLGALKEQIPVAKPPESFQQQRPDASAIQDNFTPDPLTREDICVFSCAGESFALPAPNIVRINRISARKAASILIRGYASLADFESAFQNFRAGVLDRWAKLRGKEIKSYRFEPVNRDLVRHTVTDGCTAVLVSDTQRHGIIFATEAYFVRNAAITTSVAVDDILGTFVNEDGRHVTLYEFKHLFQGQDRPQPASPTAT